MSGFAIEQIQEQMRQLKLVRTAEQLPLLLQDASKGEVAYSEFLADLLGRELAAKQERHTAMKTTIDRFHSRRAWKASTSSFSPRSSRRWCASLRPAAFWPMSTTCSCWGLLAWARRTWPWRSASGLRPGLSNGVRHRLRADREPDAGAQREPARGEAEAARAAQAADHRRDRLPAAGALGANLFFQLVSRRYERGSILITSNQSLAGWGQVFGDQVIATAILDRLLHHSTIINIKGESYRLKEKRKAGLLTRSEPYTAPESPAPPPSP